MDTRVNITNSQESAHRALELLAESCVDLSASNQLFQTLACELARVYDANYVFISIFANPEKSRVKTLAAFTNGNIADNFEYDLNHTPCQDVVNKQMEFVPENVSQLYPQNTQLTRLGVTSFFGSPLSGVDGEVLGVLSVMDVKPMVFDHWTRPVLGIYAQRIANELERRQSLVALQDTHLFLDSVIEHIPLMVFVKEARDLRFVRLNHAGEELLGLTSEALEGKNDYDFFPEAQADFFTKKDRDVIEKGEVLNIAEEEIDTASKGKRILHTRKIPIFNELGEPVYLLGISEDITDSLVERRMAARFGRLLNQSYNEIYIIEASSLKIMEVNQGARDKLGYALDELRELSLKEIVPDSRQDEFDSMIAPIISGQKQSMVFESAHQRKDGSCYPVEIHLQLSDAESPPVLVISAHDISERLNTRSELQLAENVFQCSREGILVTDSQGRVLRVNKAFSEITGYSEAEVLGQTPRLWQSQHHDKEFYRQLWKELIATGKWQGELWNRRKNGEVYPQWLSISSYQDPQDNLVRYVGIFGDITEKKLSEEHIYRLAHFDVITGLPNRVLFQERLEHALIQAQRVELPAAVIFLDLDGFKLINDSYGHPTGDKLLKIVAERLQGKLRKGDTVARLGGDEFVLLLTDLHAKKDIVPLVHSVLEAISSPYLINAFELHISASVGISFYPDDGGDVDTLVKQADIAMYDAKAKGKNTYCFFEEEMNKTAIKRMRMHSKLRRAMKKMQEFQLYYQPQVDLLSGQVFAVEALLRWRHQGQLISPDEFIPVAEESGLIVQLGEWVLAQACKQLKEWQTQGFNLQLSVNFSARQFRDPSLKRVVKDTLQSCGVAAKFLEIEITETFAMENPERSAKLFTEFKAMGVKISLDDFGIAYSSLSQLKRFPIDRLKIDRSFVKDIPSDQDDMAIASAIIAMSHQLGIRVIAEGVETQEQLAFLLENTCDELQGYLFSEPLPADKCQKLFGKKLLMA